MKNQKLLSLVVSVAMLGSAHAAGGEVKVIANASVRADSISPSELKRVYLEQTLTLSDGSHAEPVLRRTGNTHQAFLKKYLDRSDEDLQSYYRALVFSGRGTMPKQLASDAEVVSYVTKTRGAIGYVDGESRTEGVKILTVSHSGGAERKLISRVDPGYPETLKRLNIDGTVRLQVTISAKGNVEKVELLGGNPILGEAAIVAVKQWVYETAPARSVAEVSIPFDSRR